MTDAVATGPMPTVNACIAERAKAWMFPAARDQDGDVTPTKFAVTFTYVPD